MGLALRIALRFLFSNKGQTFMIALGIAIGISVQIFIGSLIQGLQISLLDSTIGRSSHITVSALDKNDPLDNAKELEQLIKMKTPELTALSPSVSGGAFAALDDSNEQMLIRGFEMDKADQLYHLKNALVAGSLPLTEDEVLVGADFVKENDLALNQWIDFQMPNGNIYPMKIMGIFDLKVASLNKTWAVVNIDKARAIFDLSDRQVTSLEMQVLEPFDVDQIVKNIKLKTKRYPAKYENWKELNASLLSGLSGQSTSSLMIQIFVVISVVLGIASVLAISVLQKSKQIGILKAMGISDSISSYIFLFQGSILGILGGILGIFFGIGLLWVFTKFALRPDGTPVVPIYINYSFIALSGLIAVVASTLAAVIPAFNSLKLSPIEVIKNG